MRAYVDSSALLKRIFAEGESTALKASLSLHAQEGVALASSALAWIEVSRAVRAYANNNSAIDVDEPVGAALSGILEKPISPEVVALARRLRAPVMRSLDAIHLASALLLDADLLIAYDQRLLAAARHHGITVSSPG